MRIGSEPARHGDGLEESDTALKRQRTAILDLPQDVDDEAVDFLDHGGNRRVCYVDLEKFRELVGELAAGQTLGAHISQEGH